MARDPGQALVFRLNDHGQGPELIRQVFIERGWFEFEEDQQDEEDWNVWWRSSRFRNCDYEKLCPWQRLNHYPKSTAVTKKDSLARNLKRMKGVYGSAVYNFSPIAFNLPNDYTKYVAEFTKLKEKKMDKDFLWICKPADLSRGRGIFIFKDISELQYDCSAVVQRYITNPFLISGYKCDLRIYVMVLSFHPLNVYIYQEGLVRFSTEKFDLGELSNMFSHLTNTSINKYSPSYTLDKERVGPGCKWTITQLRHYFHQVNIDDSLIWARIVNIVILTLIIQAHQVPKVTNCYELYGFDIIIDNNLKPWLLEVNFSPAMSSDCVTDLNVKKPMMHDLIDMLDFRQEDMLKSRIHNTGSRSRNRHATPPNLTREWKGNKMLPNITSSSSNSLLSSTGSGGAFGSYEDEDSTFRSLIPGCGLPSVQHLNEMPSVEERSSSGCSCASSSSSHTEQEVHSTRSHNRGLASRKPQLARVVEHKPSTVHSSTKLRHRSPVKRHSTLSDSGISTSSSEGLSEGSTSLSRHNPLPQLNKSGRVPSRSRASARYKGSKRKLSKLDPKSKNHLDDGDADCGDEDGDISVDTPDNDTALKKPAMFTHSKNASSSNGRLLPQSMNSLSLVSPSRSLPAKINSNPVSRKSSNITRRGSVGTLTPISTHNRTSNYTRRSLSGLPRSTAAETSNRLAANKQTKQAAERYGDFILVFPFNETTRKCALSNLDSKVVIRECQRRLWKAQNLQYEGPQLWGPLKSNSGTDS